MRALLLLILALSPAAAQPPPVAPRIPRTHSLHGEPRVDDYYWLRNRKDPRVLAYLRAENAYTDAVMRPHAKLAERIYQEILGRVRQTDLDVPYRLGRHFYYERTEAGRQYPILCRKAELQGQGPGAREEVLLDLNELARGHRFLALGAFQPSDDGDLLAYTIDTTGFREYTLYIKDLRTGQLLPDRVAKVDSVAWAADGRTLFYVTQDAAKRPYRLHRHVLSARTDPLVYEEHDERFELAVERSRSRAFLFFTSASQTATEVRLLPAATPEAPPGIIAPRRPDHEYHVDHGGDLLYIRENGGGRRNFRLVTAPVATPGPAHWREILPHREDVYLEDHEVFARHLVVHEREAGLPHLRVMERQGGATHRVALPEAVYALALHDNFDPQATHVRFAYESFVTPRSIYDYDMAGHRLVLRKRTEVLGGHDPGRYQTERLHARAADGTRVPISLVYRKDRERPGPLWLVGYGAYGVSYDVDFEPGRLSLLDRGVAFAVAHVRGGGELGKRWHDAARMLTKRNTFTDFIAAAEHLIQTGHTAKGRLVIEGRSAGGLLIGAVLNLRPELFGAALLGVPFVDVINSMSDPTLPLTVTEFEEWGDPRDPAHYAYMKSYCPYTNLARRAYPHILLRTSWNDAAVMYWEPAKYAARLRTLKADRNTLLLKVNLDGGHGGHSGRYDRWRDEAFDYAWGLTRLDPARAW